MLYGVVTMKLGLNLGYWGSHAPHDHVALAHEAENLGFDSLWTAEAYGSDAVTPLTWIAAQTKKIKVGPSIMQMTARAPAVTAMTAVTLDMLTGGRVILGIGASGPQVVEGWHGVPFGKPVTRAREYISILRKVIAREEPLSHEGEHYQIPTQGGSGLGKPIKLIVHPVRRDIPIYVGASGPKNLAMTAELADGWLAPFFSPRRMDVYNEYLDAGFARVPEKDKAQFKIVVSPPVVMGDDLKACFDKIKPKLALYFGGMGARSRNFHFNLACRYGYEAEAKKIQELYLAHRKDEAIAAVPNELVDETSLCGPKERIVERLGLWKSCGLDTMNCGPTTPETLRVLAEAVL